MSAVEKTFAQVLQARHPGCDVTVVGGIAAVQATVWVFPIMACMERRLVCIGGIGDRPRLPLPAQALSFLANT